MSKEGAPRAARSGTLSCDLYLRTQVVVVGMRTDDHICALLGPSAYFGCIQTVNISEADRRTSQLSSPISAGTFLCGSPRDL